MAEDTKNDVIARLKRIEGQIRGLQNMIEEGRECAEIVNQLAAARKALDKTGFLIITHRMEKCMKRQAGGDEEAQRTMQDALEMFLTLA